MSRITAPQLKRLQTLYNQLAAHTQVGTDRAARLAWAGELVGRSIASFSDLTISEANRLLDVLQKTPGIVAPRTRRRRLDSKQAQRHGTDGRHDGDFADMPELVSAIDLAVIDDYYGRLGWDRARFDAWLRSPHSPLKGTNPTIRTKADANRVRWALIGQLKHRGLWQERRREGEKHARSLRPL
jgi:hypothetical protein